MRIVHVIVGLNLGGAESMLVRLICALPHHNHFVVTLTDAGAIGADLASRGVWVTSLNMRQRNPISAFLSLTRIYRRVKPDVVQTWMYHADLLGGISARLVGVPRIFWNVRGTKIPQRGTSLTGMIVWVCAVLSRIIPTAVVCCSRAGLNRHVALGYSEKRMIFIPNGFFSIKGPSETEKKSARDTLGISPETLVVCIVGRFDVLKGYDVFVEAAAVVLQRSSQDIRFVCVGRGVDRANEELQAAIQRTERPESFILMGERRDLSSIYSASDVFCSASRSEGFPNVVAEAMLHGLPCVVTDVGDSALIVGNNGLVVAPNNASALSDGLMTMLRKSRDERVRLGRAAKISIERRFDIFEIAAQYHYIYSTGRL